MLVSLSSSNSRGGWTQSLDRGMARQALYHYVVTFSAIDFGIDMKIFNSNKNISFRYRQTL